jgi:hypothetical protein
MTSFVIGRNACEWAEKHRKSWKKVVIDRRHRRPSMSASVDVKKQSVGLPGIAGMSVLLELILYKHQSSKEDGSHGLTIYNRW